MPKQCKRQGCLKPVDARGLCDTHYKAWQTEQRLIAGRLEGITCACGCGQLIAKGNQYAHGHWGKSHAGRAALSAERYRGARTQHGDGYYTITDGGETKLEHIAIAEKALGHPLPVGAEVHHVNQQRDDNRHSNLVICPDAAYHSLLHRRMRALEECGNANWRKCSFCKQYDAPENLYIPPRRGTIEHRECGREYRKQRLAMKGATQ